MTHALKSKAVSSVSGYALGYLCSLQ